MLQINVFQTGLEFDTVDQLQNKLKRYTTEIESLRSRGIGKSNQHKKKIFFFLNFFYTNFFFKVTTI